MCVLRWCAWMGRTCDEQCWACDTDIGCGTTRQGPHSLVGPTNQQDQACGPYLFVGFLRLWVPGLLSAKYWIWNFIYLFLFFPNFLFPIGPVGPTVWACGAYWKQRLSGGPAREWSWSVFWVWATPDVDIFVIGLVCVL